MSLVHPFALLLAGLSVPIVLLYILKIRLRRVPVSTLIFWRQIFEEKKPRSIWQRLRHLLSLLLQLAFLALLVLALADPIFRWQLSTARRIVLVVDNSASMNAKDVSPSRLGAARVEALRVVDGLRFGDELAVISAGVQPQVRCGMTDHQQTLRDAINAVPETDGPTRVAEAVELARRLLADAEKARRVVVLTDGAFEGVAALAKEAEVEVIPVGKRTGNVGITRLQARRSLLDPIGYEILVEVVNASDSAAECRLEIDLEGDPIDVVPLKLEPGGKFSRVFEKASAEGGVLKAELNQADGLPTDNVARALLPRREMMDMTLVTPGNLFLEKVFEAIQLVRLNVVKELPAPSAASPAAPVTVLHRTVPDRLPPGPLLVIEPDRASALWDVGDKIQNPVVAKQDRDSPLLAHVRLDNVLMPEARKLTLKAPAKVLAESATGDPLYAVIDRPEGKVILLTVDLDKSDLPLQTAFPILMTNALGWFAGTKGELREAIPAGSVTEVALGPQAGTAGAPEFVLRAPDGREQILPKGQAKVTVGPLDRCGIWSVVRRDVKGSAAKPASGTEASKQDRPIVELACNLADRRESDLRPADGLSERTAGLASGFGGRPFWYYLLATAWLLSCWEWFLYQRRWIE